MDILFKFFDDQNLFSSGSRTGTVGAKRNYCQIWLPNYWMSFVVLGIVEVSYSIVNCVRADDWTAERAIIASNDVQN